MALSVTHTKVVVTADDGASEVGSDEWNATHTLTGTISVGQGGTGVTALGALTKTDDTNVTLTLGGSPSTALVNAASLTLGWTGSLAATRGGTGQSTFTKGDILASPGSNTLNALGVGSDGLVLTADAASTNGVKWAAASASILPLHLTDANTVEQYNSTTAQTFRVYRTFTDTSNYERGMFDLSRTSSITSAAVLSLGYQAAGTGTQRGIEFIGGSTYPFFFFFDGNPASSSFWYMGGIGDWHGRNSGFEALSFDLSNGGGVQLSSVSNILFNSATSILSGSIDTAIHRNAAGVLEINSGTAGTFKNLIIARLSRAAPLTKTNDWTVGADEYSFISNRAATNTVTLPAAASFPGREILIKTIQAQTVVSASSNVAPQTDSAAGTAILAATDGAWAELISDGTNWIIMTSSSV